MQPWRNPLLPACYLSESAAFNDGVLDAAPIVSIILPMKIVSTFVLTAAQRQLILEASPDAIVVDPTQVPGRKARHALFDAEVMAPHLADCDVMIAYTIPKDLVARAPRLKWLHCMAAGLDYVLRTGMFESGKVVLTNTSGAQAAMIGEYVIMAMLAYAHRYHISIRAQSRHEWMGLGYYFSHADNLRGKTVGIIGYGPIGREAARLADAFGMEVMALKRDPAVHADPRFGFPAVGDPEGRIPRRWFGPDQRAEIVSHSDFIVVALPLTQETRHFLGERELAVAKPGACLVNVGRGEVIDQDALIRALADKRLGGAALDVMVPEPLPADHPLWDLEDAILTPHSAGPNKGYQEDCCRVFAENLRRFLGGRELLNVVEVKRGY
jgi:phosphoglycerate dehydrogenase-like enzyme